MLDHSCGGMQEIINFSQNCSAGNFAEQMLEWKGGDFHNIKTFITAFRILEFSLVLSAIAKKNLSVDEIIKIIYSVNDMLDHSCGGMQEILNFSKNCTAENFAEQMLRWKNE